MPKRKDGPDAKKARKSSSASKDATSASPSSASEIVPPPNPTATHLVASNPFDDPIPSNHMKMMQNFPGQPMMRMAGPGPVMGSGYPGPGWGPRSTVRSHYAGPGPGWNSAMGSHPGYHPNIPSNPNMPSNGYGRPRFPGTHMAPYHAPGRIPGGNMRPSLSHMGSAEDIMLPDIPSMGPNHMVSSGNQGHMLQNTGQMKALTRPMPQMPSPTTRKNSLSASKSAAAEGKSPKTSDAHGNKTRKKSEKKLSQESKSKATEEDKLTSNSDKDRSVPPHAVLPKEPQTCKRCNKNIDLVAEDPIRCIASCNMWYHRTCVGLTQDAYKLLKTEELAIWACDHCLQTKEIHSVLPRTSLMEGPLATA